MNQTEKFRFVIWKQHGGTGFPMGLFYATDIKKEAISIAKAFMAVTEGNVYFSVGDSTKPPLKRSRFIYRKDAIIGPLPKVMKVELGRHTPDGSYFWATLHFENGWEKAVLWPDVIGSPADISLTSWGKYYNFSGAKFIGV